MPKRIQEDHVRFKDVISGRTRKELMRLKKSAEIVRLRPKGGKVIVNVPQIEQPFITFGDNGSSIGRGPGKPGDVIGRDPQPGDGKPGDEASEGIRVAVDLEYLYEFMEDELKLPRIQPKANQTFEEVRVKYNNISKVGLNSLRHTRRTMKEALKRRSMTGELDQLQRIPGASVPVRLVTPIKSDFRYRQYKEIKVPSANAVLFFARDSSGSMDDYRCDIVTDMCYWLDCWIRRSYKRVDRCFYIHDTRAIEVSEEDFYAQRLQGGTRCSSAFELVADQLVNRYPPSAYNVYFFYFTDGENEDNDNSVLRDIIKERLGETQVNLMGLCQVGSRYDRDLFHYLKNEWKNHDLGEHITFAEISRGGGQLPEQERNQQIIDGMRALLTVPNL